MRYIIFLPLLLCGCFDGYHLERHPNKDAEFFSDGYYLEWRPHKDSEFFPACLELKFTTDQCLFFRYGVDWRRHASDAGISK